MALDPCSIILLGASGDLTHRKLVPALWELYKSELLPERFAIVGIARRPWSDAEFRSGLQPHLTDADDPDRVKSFLDAVRYFQLSFDDSAGYAEVEKSLRGVEKEYGLTGNRLFYLSTAPEHFVPIVRRLGEHGLVRRRSGEGKSCPVHWSRVIVEKPFGRDLPSAVDLNGELLDVLDESQIFRIDHYLGKETVQNILAFRFSNGIFEPLWNHNYVDHVQITVAESIGVGSRGGYYDKAGALRDMVQNHMMQLLALVAMEPPISLEADAIRNEKVKVLQALRPLRESDIGRNAIRAQYTRSQVDGDEAKGYLDETQVPADSKTPTYTALKLHVDNWRWSGTPFLLRHGKRLPRRVTEIAIQFRKPPMRLFDSVVDCDAVPNTLVLEIQPTEGISLSFGSKIPGPAIHVGQVTMDFLYSEAFHVESNDAYERLLLDALAGDSTLFIRSDEVESSWRYMDPVLGTWARDEAPLDVYKAGTWGPESADQLFEDIEGGWREPKCSP